MNIDWIMSPLAVYGVLCAASVAFLYLLFAAQVELQRQARTNAREREEMAASLAALAAKVEGFVSVAPERSGAGSGPATMNLHKRSLALRLYQKGAEVHTITAAVGLPQAELTLLGKVHQILSGAADEAPPRSLA